MANQLVKKLGLFVLLATLLASLSSCGRRGALQAPSAGFETEQGEAAPVEEAKPDREFILDGLI